MYRAESHGQAYGFELTLFEGIVVEESRWNTKGRNIILNISKANKEAEYWPRLTRDKIKNAHINIDWAKWVDEDEEDQAKPLNEDWNEDNMNNFDMGGYQGGDSDDEEEEEEEHKHDHGHVHGENCNHDHGEHVETEAKKKNADLGDLDEEVETNAASEQQV